MIELLLNLVPGPFPNAIAVFFMLFLLETVVMGCAKALLIFTLVGEREAQIYTLFGNVLGVVDEPGIHFLWLKFGPQVLLVRFFGRVYYCDMRLDQQYLRSTPVNSEEGAPMGIGIWYEMAISDPLAHVFKNTDPRGSLRANVGNAAMRSLSNMPLSEMLENRHRMSSTVGAEVSPQCKDWGYSLGSVYIRKVHFRDQGMIKQIQEKVVNRLRQVTSAITQDGVNQVNLIASAAEKEAAIELARASAMRPKIVGDALQQLAKDKEVVEALFSVLEIEQIIAGKGVVTLIPKTLRQDTLTHLQATLKG
jgi:regulator of protease activity HflC (stomatin/prohibitin superfamily)